MLIALLLIGLAITTGMYLRVWTQLRSRLREHEEAEAKARAHHALLNNVLSHIPYCVFWKDRQSVYLGGNDKFARDKGLKSANEVVGRTQSHFTPSKEEADFYEACDREVMASGEAMLDIEETVTRRDGRQLTVLTSKVPMRDEKGNVIGILGIYADITARKRQEVELAESRRFLQSTLDSLPVMVGILDNEGDVVAANEAWKRVEEQVPGATPVATLAETGVMAGMNYLQSCQQSGRGLPKEEADAIRALVKGVESVLTGKLEETAHEVCREVPGGGKRWYIVRANRLANAPRGAKAVVSQLDITERRHAQSEREELNQKLVEASRKAGMAEVAAGVLHNVGNVLNSVNVAATVALESISRSKAGSLPKLADLVAKNKDNFGEYVTTDPAGKKLPDYLIALSGQITTERQGLVKELEGMTKNVEHLKQIVAMHQSIAGSASLAAPVDLSGLIDSALQIHASAFDRHHVRLVREIDPEVNVAFVDRHRALQILVNLFNNAKQAMDCLEPGERVLTVSVMPSVNPGRVQVNVTDRGVGISQENLQKIFQYGFTTKKDGHGFGLHSAAIAANDMGGALRVSSEGEGKGATFTLELPVDKEAHAASSAPDAVGAAGALSRAA